MIYNREKMCDIFAVCLNPISYKKIKMEKRLTVNGSSFNLLIPEYLFPVVL
jgi:hypothetical protein